MTPQKWHTPDGASAAKFELFEQAKDSTHVSNTAEERAEGFNEYFAHIALHIFRCNFIIFRITHVALHRDRGVFRGCFSTEYSGGANPTPSPTLLAKLQVNL